LPEPQPEYGSSSYLNSYQAILVVVVIVVVVVVVALAVAAVIIVLSPCAVSAHTKPTLFGSKILCHFISNINETFVPDLFGLLRSRVVNPLNNANKTKNYVKCDKTVENV